MKELGQSGIYNFIKMERTEDIDKFSMGIIEEGIRKTFGFFKPLGMVDYSKSFKTWLREFPRPIFIAATREKAIVAWVYITNLNITSRHGDSVYVLRAIETLEQLRGRKIGLRLLMLGLNQVSGYMVTKPLNQQAEKFFRDAGFKGEKDFKSLPIDMSGHHGYLILPPFKKEEILEQFGRYFSPEGDE